jgi:hypothetical protein
MAQILFHVYQTDKYQHLDNTQCRHGCGQAYMHKTYKGGNWGKSVIVKNVQPPQPMDFTFRNLFCRDSQISLNFIQQWCQAL